MSADLWLRLPSSPGEHSECFDSPLINITVTAQNWSNKEQRRLPIDKSTKWGAWVNGCQAIGLQFASIDDAKRAGIEEAIKMTRAKMARLQAALGVLVGDSQRSTEGGVGDPPPAMLGDERSATESVSIADEGARQGLSHTSELGRVDSMGLVTTLLSPADKEDLLNAASAISSLCAQQCGLHCNCAEESHRVYAILKRLNVERT